MSVLLVTGSSRGIGAGICIEAAKRGWKVCVNYAQSEEEALAVVSDIKGAGGKGRCSSSRRKPGRSGGRAL